MNDHVGKPFGPEELMEKISHCLATKEKGIRVIRGLLIFGLKKKDFIELGQLYCL